MRRAPLMVHVFDNYLYIFYIHVPGKYIYCMKKSFYADVAMTTDLEFY